MSRSITQQRRTELRIESLEDRKLMYATLGAGWTFGNRITLSLAPDGTNIGGQSSALFQSLASRGITASAVQTAFSKAASAWQAAANINLVFVTDNGASFSSSGNQQGDSNFGDIRIGATPLSSSVLATSFLPPPSNGGTLAGDIVFNTSQAWRINSDFDLQTVAIHEIGHSLGMDHSAIAWAAMYGSYTGMKQSLSLDDMAGIASIYGTRASDFFDASASNGTWATASNLNSYLDTNRQIRLSTLDVTSSSDMDWFVVTAPAGSSGTLTVTMQSSDLSLLSPRVTLFNGALQTLGNTAAANSFGSTVTTTFTGVVAGQQYYVRAMAANGGTSGVGAYGLLVNFGTGTMSPIAPPNTTVPSTNDLGSGSLSLNTTDNATDEDHVWVGTLKGLGDRFEFNQHPPRRELFGLFGIGVAAAGKNDWADMFAPPILAYLQTVQSKGNRANLKAAIDEVLASWDD